MPSDGESEVSLPFDEDLSNASLHPQWKRCNAARLRPRSRVRDLLLKPGPQTSPSSRIFPRRCFEEDAAIVKRQWSAFFQPAFALKGLLPPEKLSELSGRKQTAATPIVISCSSTRQHDEAPTSTEHLPLDLKEDCSSSNSDACIIASPGSAGGISSSRVAAERPHSEAKPLDKACVTESSSPRDPCANSNDLEMLEMLWQSLDSVTAAQAQGAATEIEAAERFHKENMGLERPGSPRVRSRDSIPLTVSTTESPLAQASFKADNPQDADVACSGTVDATITSSEAGDSDAETHSVQSMTSDSLAGGTVELRDWLPGLLE